ncbi:MAG: hypothetical protein J5918_08170 [Prevotella sp.]|nr:hypothetical protein [Prevotella sp.]
MDILDELTNKFTDLLDTGLVASPDYQKASALLNDFSENKLSEEQSKELTDLVGSLSSAIFRASTRAGMKLGAAISAGLLMNGGDNNV